MPTYLYKCGKCGEFEAEQKMSDPPLSKCPTCGKKPERQIAGGAGFVLKGKNWISKMASPGDSPKKIAERAMKQTVGEVAEDIARHSKYH